MSKIVTLYPRTPRKLVASLNQVIPPLRGEKLAQHISRLASSDNIRIIITENCLRVSKKDCSQSFYISHSESYAKKLRRAGIKEIEVEQGALPEAIKKDLDWCIANPSPANQGVILINGQIANELLKSTILGDRLTAMKALIMLEIMTPELLAQMIFRRALNFKPAHTATGKVVPQKFEIDEKAIRECKQLLSSLPDEIRKQWEPAIAKKLIELGTARYDIAVSDRIENTTLSELSFLVSKLLNQIGLQ